MFIILSEKELAIREYKQALARKNQYSLATNNNNNNGIWKTAIIVIGFGLLAGCFGGIAYLIGQSSRRDKYNRCKC